MLLAALERFSEDANTLADLTHFHDQLSKVDPGTVLECAWHASWRMLDADDTCIVSRSLRGLEQMAVFVEVFGAFGLTISESKTETTCMSIPRAPATQIVFNATDHQYNQTTSPIWGFPALTPHTCRSRLTGRSVRGGRASSVTRGTCITSRRQVCCT